MKAQWAKDTENYQYINGSTHKDIIKTEPTKKVTYENGKRIEETIYKRRNITQEVNETAKMLKLNTLTSKLNELKRNFEE